MDVLPYSILAFIIMMWLIELPILWFFVKDKFYFFTVLIGFVLLLFFTKIVWYPVLKSFLQPIIVSLIQKLKKM